MRSPTKYTTDAILQSLTRRWPLTDVDERTERLRRLAWRVMVIEPVLRILGHSGGAERDRLVRRRASGRDVAA